MRIYAVADIHSRPERIVLIQKTIRNHGPDVLVVAGDISGYFRSNQVLADLNDMGPPVLIVRGNTDRFNMERHSADYSNISSLHLRSMDIAGICFAGVGGTLPMPFRTRLCFRETRYLNKLKSIIQPRTVFVAHPPPYGTLDEVAGKWHAGSKTISALIDANQPRLFICGHIHERPGIVAKGKTLVVNCSIGRNGAGALIELDDQKIRSAELL